ncbi:MAG: MmcQ/YjbR family DNA-binding protein [Sediminicola sp.]
MDIEEFRNYCISKKGVTEEFPFGEDTLVFKVMGKMFALLPLETPGKANLKCNPEYAVELREAHDGIIVPGFHMNKTHWNTLYFENQLAPKLIRGLIDHSYDLVVSGLTKKDRSALGSL